MQTTTYPFQRTTGVGQRIREETKGVILDVLDCVGIESSAAICAEAIGTGGTYCTLLPIDCPWADVKSIFFLGYSMSGESYICEGDHYEARPEDLEFALSYVSIAEKLWTDGDLKPHPQRIGSGGLQGAIAGMHEMREGRYSGEKLVYRIDETERSDTIES